MKSAKVIELVAAHDIFFALAHSGVCAAFSRESNKRICFLNVSPDEVIRSLFYITVSVYASDNFSSLKCRSTRIECVELFSVTVADLLSSRIFFDILSYCFLTLSIFRLIP
ncbi:hypothetical protein RHGRI_011683 [Rhododendron griersonianum]|uniref:Uncharacterized protein n=1 Tax=Rhododendron griersonianum TaxID=479676 RepID=A0AAV6KMW0_9ERIC|nr:hypothetical protein RHGRI_011683 [Rhododendron griersonianum]